MLPAPCAGVSGVEAEAELLAAMVMFFQRVGLTAQDVVIKVSSRQVLQAVLEEHKVPVEATSRVFVTVDKMDKLPKETVGLLCACTVEQFCPNSVVQTCLCDLFYAQQHGGQQFQCLSPEFCGTQHIAIDHVLTCALLSYHHRLISYTVITDPES